MLSWVVRRRAKRCALRIQSLNANGNIMQGFVQDIESIAVRNEEFRRVLYTAKNCQVVVMALKPNEEIGAEVHIHYRSFRVAADQYPRSTARSSFGL